MHLPSICHVTITLGKMWLNSKSFFVLCNTHIIIMQLQKREQKQMPKHQPVTKDIHSMVSTASTTTLPDNRLHPRVEDYRCAMDSSHKHQSKALVPAYSFHHCTNDEHAKSASPHQQLHNRNNCIHQPQPNALSKLSAILGHKNFHNLLIWQVLMQATSFSHGPPIFLSTNRNRPQQL